MIKFYNDKDKPLEANYVFLVDHDSGSGCNPGMLMSYCPIGQHSEASVDYINSCKKISKAQYIKTSGGLYTPPDYLE